MGDGGMPRPVQLGPGWHESVRVVRPFAGAAGPLPLVRIDQPQSDKSVQHYGPFGGFEGTFDVRHPVFCRSSDHWSMG